MSLFRSIAFASLLAGLLTGLVTSGLQLVGTTPLILAAEAYETASSVAPDAAAHAAEAAAPAAPHTHDHGEAGHHHHDPAAWTPADGLERTSATLVANILTAFGYALLLTGLMAARGRPVDWRSGLLWGLGGFACVMLAPSLGLPPELPGAPEIPLVARQTWWIATVALTAGGLGLIAFVHRPWAAVLAVAAIVAPHLIGAPLAPDGVGALAPTSLDRQFVAAAVITSLVFWAMLGTLSGALLKRTWS